jgi:hypothetical protein
LNGNFTLDNTIFDPLSYNVITGTRQAFAGNIIPASRINAVSKNFFPYIPVVNSLPVQGANVVGTPVQGINDDRETVRADYLLSPKNSLFGRQTWEKAPLRPASLVPDGGQLVDSAGWRRSSPQTRHLLSSSRIWCTRARACRRRSLA